jgi:hypothetical protein
MTDRLTVPGDDDVALVHTSLGSWSLRFDVHDHHASSTALDRDQLEADTEITPRDVSIFLKPRRDTLNGGGRDHKDAPARSEHCHTHHPALRTNGKTAFGTLPHAEIKFVSPPRKDHQEPALRDTTPNAAVGAPSSAPTARTRAPTGLCLKPNRRYVGAIDAQKRNVGGVITSNKPCRDGVAAW